MTDVPIHHKDVAAALVWGNWTQLWDSYTGFCRGQRKCPYESLALCLRLTGLSCTLLGAVSFACTVAALHHCTLYSKQELHSLYTNMSCGRCIMDLLSRLPPTNDLLETAVGKHYICLSLRDFRPEQAPRKRAGPGEASAHLKQRRAHARPLHLYPSQGDKFPFPFHLMLGFWKTESFT